MARKFLFVCTGLLMLSLALDLGERSVSAQGTNVLVSMADYPRLPASAVAVDQGGGIYFGHQQQWSRVGTAPGRPVTIWSRNDGAVFVGLENGDLYQLGNTALPVGNWPLTFDSNVFSGGATLARQHSWGQVKVDHR